MTEPIHKNKKFMSLFYDKCRTLVDNFSDEEIGQIMRAAIHYELTGEKPDINDRLIQVTVTGLYTDIDLSTAAADKRSKINRENRLGKRKPIICDDPEDDPDFEDIVRGTYKLRNR